MNAIEKIAIMKYEARLANRARADGIKNWTPESRAASLAKRRSMGSVWGWNKRKRASDGSGIDASMTAMAEDAESVRRSLSSQRAGVPVLAAPSQGGADIAAQRLESFKAWLTEIKRVEMAIDDFNGVVAAAGGLGGVVGAKGFQRIVAVRSEASTGFKPDKAPLEKSIRRQFEKNGGSYLRENPEAKPAFDSRVAEKAEYYASTHAERVEMEKDAYRRIVVGGELYNRAHSSKCAGSSSPDSECTCSCGGSQHGGAGDGEKIKLTAVTDVEGKKQAGGKGPDGNDFYASIGDVIGDGDTITAIDTVKETVTVKGKDGKTRVISMNGESNEVPEGEPDQKSTGEAYGQSDDETRMEKIVDAFGKEVSDVSDAAAVALDRYQEYGPTQITQEERATLLEAMADSENKSPELEYLTAELQAAEEVFKDVKDQLSEEVKEKVISLQDCLDEVRKPGNREEYNMKVDALNTIYRDAVTEAFRAQYNREPENQEEWDAVQKATNVPADFFTEFDGGGEVENRWSDASRAAALIVRRANAAARKASMGVSGPKGKTGPSGVAGVDGDPLEEKAARERDAGTDYGKMLKEKGINLENVPSLGTGRFSAKYKRAPQNDADMKEAQRLNDEAGNTEFVSPATVTYEESVASMAMDKYGAEGMTEEERALWRGALEKKASLDKSEKKELAGMIKASETYGKVLSGFGAMIAEGKRPTEVNLKAQLKIDKNKAKYRMAMDALNEAYHSKSLDMFQDKFSRDPRNNKEFRDFQRSKDIPSEYIGGE
jgi:hypothetical protein